MSYYITPYTVDALSDTTIAGKVIEISDYPMQNLTSTEQNANYMVKIEVVNPPKTLKSGMSANADIITDLKENVLYIPIQAVVMYEDEKDKDKAKNKYEKKDKEEAVFVVTDENKVAIKKIKTGIYDSYDIEVTEGLVKDEKIVTGPYKVLAKLKKDDKVKLNKNGNNKKGNK